MTIRSAVLTFDTSKAAITSLLFGGLLGGNVSISAAGWNGLVNTDISLLGYLNRLKIDLGLTAVGYDQVLGNTINVSQLIQTAINVLDPNGTLGASATIVSLQALKVAAGTTSVVLGNMLHVESGTDISTLAVNLKAFDLIEGFVQLANKKNAAVATLPINIAGLAQITARVQVMEPPQLSAIGNPKTRHWPLWAPTASMYARLRSRRCCRSTCPCWTPSRLWSTLSSISLHPGQYPELIV